jgi:hypothetical protein
MAQIRSEISELSDQPTLSAADEKRLQELGVEFTGLLAAEDTVAELRAPYPIGGANRSDPWGG